MSTASHAADAIRALDLLPALSPVAVRLLEVAATESAELHEIADLIGFEPALSARVLSLCRRANLGVSPRITTVRQAVVMLGLDAVRAAVLSVCIHDALEAAADASLLPVERLGCWTRCLSAACAAERLAPLAAPVIDPSEAFCAGLLHDIGLIAFVAAIPRVYTKIAEHAQAAHTSAAATERRLLGIDHHDAGARLCERWSLPAYIAQSARYHALPPHAVPESPHARLVMLVTLAESLARRAHLGWSPDFDEPIKPEGIADRLALPQDAVRACFEELPDLLSARCDALGIEPLPTTRSLLEGLNQANQRIALLHKGLAKRASEIAVTRRTIDAMTALAAREADAYDLSDAMTTIAGVCADLGVNPVRCVVRSGGQDADTFDFAGNTAIRRDDAWESTSEAGGQTREPLTAIPLQGGREVALYADASREGRDTVNSLRPAIAAILSHALALEQNRSAYERLARANREVIELQRALVERQSLARLGEMASGAAHEMNTQLAVIKARAQVLEASLGDLAIAGSATTISEAATELADIIRSLSEVASPPAPSMARHDVTDVLLRATELSGVDFELVGHHKENSVLCDDNLLSRAVAELLRNAREADPHHAPRVALATGEGSLTICISDSGPGFSPEALRNAFNPFFSHRQAGRGRGMGLARARAFLEAMGGSVSIDSRPPSATTVRVSVPTSDSRDAFAA